MSDIIINEDFDVAYSRKSNVIYGMNSKASGAQEVRTKQAIVKSEGSGLIEKWGDDNMFPQQVIEDVEKNIELSAALEKKAKLASSLELVYGIPDPNNKKVLLPLPETEDAEISDFLELTNFDTFKYECAKDLIYFYNAFPELVLDKARNKIVQISTRQAEQCRWSKQNPQTGMYDLVYINANWATGGKPEDENTIKIPVIDNYYDPAGALKLRNDGLQYILPLNLASPGRDKYQLAAWNAVRASGWLTIAASIPEIKKAIMENLMLVHYHIEISSMYWEWKYKDWGSIAPEKRAKIKEDEIQAIEDVLQGYKNAGKNIVTSFKSDATGKDWPGVKITAIDKKIQDDIFLKDDERSSSKILTAINLHPALMGVFSSTGLGQGGGSDIREAYNLNTIEDHIIHKKILEPLYVAKRFNGWNPKIKFALESKFMTTLDKGKETSTSKA